MSTELRRTKRQTLTSPSAIMSRDGTWKRDCYLSNISMTGAKIRVQDSANLPEQFVLLLSERGSVKRHCRVVWRKEKLIGVSFQAA